MSLAAIIFVFLTWLPFLVIELVYFLRSLMK